MLSAKSFVVVLVLALGLVLAACGGGATPAAGGTSAPSGSREIKVDATDFKFTPGDQTFKAGETVKVTVTNKGAVDHTWVLTDSSGKELFKLEIAQGKTASKDLTVPTTPGAYIIVCDIAGHKEAGMTAKATVQ
jgi:uncharacterized cupredoxin-like copper-binding protein